MASKYRKEIFQVAIWVILYVVLGNARSVQANAIIPGDVIAINMVIPVLAGILYGRGHGLLVGFIGTFLNALSPAGTVFEFLAIVPHSIMGFLAGYFKDKAPTPILALSLLVGHLLNLIVFILFGLFDVGLIVTGLFWGGLLYEVFIGIVAVMIIKGIYTLGSVQ